LKKAIKKVFWIGSSYKDLMDFPDLVRRAMGHALFSAREGKLHPHAKILSGMGSAGVQEIRENDGSGTYRVIYTIEMKECVFVLHAFQKKSKSGIATPKQELELLNARLKEAKALYKSMNV
jgi:phage-related protein